MLCWVKRFRYKYMIGIPAFLVQNTTISSEGGVGFSHIFPSRSLLLYIPLFVWQKPNRILVLNLLTCI